MTASPEYSTNAACISYFDPFDVFESIKQQFLEVFPLQNIHLKTANGSLRTINEVPVNLFSESKTFESESKDIKLFIRFLVVNCISADDYRARVRPLVKQWLPSSENDGVNNDVTRLPLPVILLYANSEVVDFKLFKSTSLIDKFGKDFPDVKTLELKSVYKSKKEKGEFWSQMSQRLKSYILDVFQERLAYNQAQLKKSETSPSLVEEMLYKENILQLYLALNMLEETQSELEQMKQSLWSKFIEKLPLGELDVPFHFPQGNNAHFKVAEELSMNRLTKYKAYYNFFAEEFQIIMKGNLDSLSSLRLFKLIRGFLHSVSQLFIQEAGFLEFKYSFHEACLQFLSNNEIPAFKELRAELLLAKRDCWVQGVLGCSTYKLMDKSFPSTGIAYSFGKFEDTYATEEVFHKYYTNFTRDVISVLSQCEQKRQRTIDILSIEIGFLHYQRKEYEKAVALFLSCYEYYMQSKWDLIGIRILKIFVDSLVQCQTLTELEIDNEMVPTSVILSNAYLNILRISTGIKEKGKWWTKFAELHLNSPTDLVYATEGLFSVSFANCVRLVKPNVLSIDVFIENNQIPEEIEANMINFVLKRDDDTFLEFHQREVLLSSDTITYPLQATEVCYGKFKAVSVEIIVGTTTFIKEFLNDDVPELLIEPLFDSNNVTLMIEQAPRFNLGEYALQLSTSNADQLKSSQVIITIINDSSSSTYPASFIEDGQESIKHISDLREVSSLPYFLNEAVTSFTVAAKFTFTRVDSNKVFSESRTFNIDCCLPISVSVEDIFKRDSFIFKFLLNSSTIEKPVVLHSTKLLPPSNRETYDVSGDFNPEASLCLSANLNEICYNCYQITTQEIFTPNDCFHLQINYNTLKEQLDNLVTDAILVQGNVEWYRIFEPWKYVWELTVLPLLRYSFDAFRENMIVVLLEGSSDILQIGRVFRQMSIDDVVSQAMMMCLKRLKEGVQLSEIDIQAYSKNLTPKVLVVPVELPKLEQFFYVEFLTKESNAHTVGVPMTLNIKIESLNARWGHQGLIGKFLFEISSSNEWLVHGRKRLLISDEVTEVSLHLIPLKRGYLNFPKVEITNIDTEEPSRIDNASYFETVLVF